jgi:hypothetical protein
MYTRDLHLVIYVCIFSYVFWCEHIFKLSLSYSFLLVFLLDLWPKRDTKVGILYVVVLPFPPKIFSFACDDNMHTYKIPSCRYNI